MVVGAVISFRKTVLLCKRAIEPSRGLWTIPAGYLEENESTEEGLCAKASMIRDFLKG